MHFETDYITIKAKNHHVYTRIRLKLAQIEVCLLRVTDQHCAIVTHVCCLCVHFFKWADVPHTAITQHIIILGQPWNPVESVHVYGSIKFLPVIAAETNTLSMHTHACKNTE